MGIPRNQWVRALTAHSANTVLGLAARVQDSYEIVHTSLPQAGLGLLKMRDGALSEAYYIGEIPLACAHIELRDASGRRYPGAAQVMSESMELAEALAICDAVLAHRLPHWEIVMALVEKGVSKRKKEVALRKAMLVRTRVNFSLLSNVEDDNES